MRITILMISLFTLLSCKDSGSGNQNLEKLNVNEMIGSKRIQKTLTLKLDLTYSLSHGWGHVYSGKVIEVISGDFKNSTIELNISVSDFEKKFSHIITNELNNLVIVEFTLIDNDKPYVNGQNAFIDENNQTWEIMKIKVVNT